MAQKKNYNYMTAAGKVDYDDADLARDFGIDPNLAYTPEINKALMDANLKKVREGMEKQGNTPEEIDTYVNQARKDVMSQIKSAEELSNRKLM